MAVLKNLIIYFVHITRDIQYSFEIMLFSGLLEGHMQFPLFSNIGGNGLFKNYVHVSLSYMLKF